MSIQEKVARAFCQASCDIKNCPCHYADGDQELKEATAAITAFLEAAAEQGNFRWLDESKGRAYYIIVNYTEIQRPKT